MQNIYQTFEFNKIQEELLEFAKTEVAKDKIETLEMLPSKEAVIEALEDLKEMHSIVTRFGPLPIDTSANALYLIDLAKKTGLLTCRDLHLIANDVLTCQNIVRFFDKIDLSYARIRKMTENFFDLTPLEKEIHRNINSALIVVDNATPELKEIRGKIKKAEAELNSKVATLAFKYSSYLNDENATLRDGHFVLPVRTVEKSKVMGIVHDVSSSGGTTFVEPLEIVELNNTITALKVAENEEVRKILKQLTALVLLQESEIVSNNAIIGKLDFLSCKSFYANKINAEIAEVSDKQEIELIDARHPLIDERKVVSNTYIISGDKRIVIISGPNAGGKTVSLKTVGLLVMMNQCGLAVPTNRAKLGYFNHIYIDIGDNQSLSDNLSTFSAHMHQISEITDVVKGKDLVLLDELGTGTDPREGEAIALGAIKYLEHKNCIAMVSSHFDALKEYAFLSPNLENSSMIFDEEKLLPTFKFKLGSPGHSYAINVANRYGLNNDIVQSAKDFLASSNKSDTNELLEILQRKIQENSLLEESLKKRERELENKLKKYENDSAQLSIKRETLLKDVEEEKNRLLQDTKEEIEEIMEKLKGGNVKLHEVIEVKKKVQDLEEHKSMDVYDEKINPGDYVSVPSLGINGKVVKFKGNKAHIFGDNGFTFDIDLDKLHKIDAPKQVKRQNVLYSSEINTSVGLELNIIGLHLDEAKETLVKYLDNCMLKGFPTCRIIHGFGSGALRKMTREYLDYMKIKYRAGGEAEGGGGATVVILRDK